MIKRIGKGLISIMKEINERLASNLKAILNQRHMTQKQLAKAIDEPYTTVNNWFRGVFYPRPEMLEKLSRELGVSKDELTKPLPRYFTSPAIASGDAPVKLDNGLLLGKDVTFWQIMQLVDKLSDTDKKRALTMLKAAFLTE